MSEEGAHPAGKRAAREAAGTTTMDGLLQRTLFDGDAMEILPLNRRSWAEYTGPARAITVAPCLDGRRLLREMRGMAVVIDGSAGI